MADSTVKKAMKVAREVQEKKETPKASLSVPPISVRPWVDNWKGPRLTESIPFGASPARSYARAMNFPLSEHPALSNVTVRSDRTSEFPSGMSYHLFDKGGWIAKLTGSMMGYDTQGIYDPDTKTVSYKGRRPALEISETLAHEFGHPIQRYEEERAQRLGDLWLKLGGMAGRKVGEEYLESPARLWKRVEDRNVSAPNYEDTLPYWIGQQYAGFPVPPGVGAFLSRFYRNK